MVQGAKPRARIGKRIKDGQNDIKNLYSLHRRSNTVTGRGVTFTAGAGAAANNGQSDSGFLRTSGDTMIGPIAFFPKLIEIASDAIDIGKNTDNFTGRVILNAETGTSDDLATITGANHAGQLLNLQGTVGETITIKDGTGNIHLATGGDVSLSGNDNILMVFDSVSNEWTNVAPVADSSGGGAGANTALSNLIATAINQSLISDTDSTYDLGSSTLAWADLFLDKVRFPNQDTITVNAHNIARNISDNLEINVPTGDAINFAVNGVTIFDIDANNMTGNTIILSDTITLQDSSTQPTVAGEFRNDAADVYVFSGGAARNLSSIGAAGGANVNLSNLAATAVNTSIISDTDSTDDLGSSLIAWADLFIDKVRFPNQDTITVNAHNIARDTSDNLEINVPTGDAINFAVNGVTIFDVDANTMTGNNIILSGSHTINDSATDPTVNGEFRRNSADVKVFSGGASRNLSFVPGSAAATIELDNLGTVAINTSLVSDLDSTDDLGSSLIAWHDVWADKIRFPNQDTITINAHNIGRDTSDNLELNVPTGDAINFAVNGVTIFDIDANSMTGNNITLSGQFTLNDSSTDPTAPGEFRRNSADVKVFTGGSVVNLTNVGSGGSGHTIQDEGSGLTQRTNLNFVGTGVTATDDSGNDATVVTINLAGAGFATTELDNLGITSINADLLLANANLDIGSTGTPLDGLFAKRLVIENGTLTNGETMITESATGDMILNVATGDQIQFKVNGTTIFDIDSGNMTGNNIILSNTFTLQDSSTDPSAAGEFTRNSADVKVFSGGAVRNLSNIAAGSGDEFEDVVFRIIDDIDNTRKLAFQAGGIAASTTRTWTAQDASGTVCLLDSGDTQIFSDDIRPSTNGTLGLGTSSNHYDDVFTETLTLRGSGGNTVTSINSIYATATEMVFQIPNVASTVFRFKEGTGTRFSISEGTIGIYDGSGGTEQIRITPSIVGDDAIQALNHDLKIFRTGVGDQIKLTSTAVEINNCDLDMQNNDVVDTGDIFVGGGDVVRASGSTEIGLQVSNDVITVGGFGTMQIPTDTGSAGSAANADTDFGNANGCMGIYLSSGGNPVLCFREADGDWATEILTGGDLT